MLGVFAQARFAPGPDRFTSSVRLDQLHELEEWVKGLRSPRWPEHLGGPYTIDPGLAARGEKLYRSNCVACHALRDPDGRFPQNLDVASELDPNVIRVVATPLEVLRTDPKFLMNFGAKSSADSLADLVSAGRDDQVPRPALLQAVVRQVIGRTLAEQGLTPGSEEFQRRLAQLGGFRRAAGAPPLGGRGYKSRPLDGAWATAPYLHNGSVPNLEQMLLPEEDRVDSFYLGSRRFDPVRVGFETGPGQRRFEFRSEQSDGSHLAGNSNLGHSGPRFTQTTGQDGAYRDFLGEERRALIEFIKTIE
ncbi:hypothetical protein ElP_10960 [Tautonia plasticadhaerens]|uniref:Cytochrome c domain-containing protein n=1 Tax=Tautonia plasticadhaerens TaxID=2527974 RepID=A0A518GXF6_9BACT|nr:hypothetical protein ElP_10960 [Tautonia plasticadhaerens]